MYDGTLPPLSIFFYMRFTKNRQISPGTYCKYILKYTFVTLCNILSMIHSVYNSDTMRDLVRVRFGVINIVSRSFEGQFKVI